MEMPLRVKKQVAVFVFRKSEGIWKHHTTIYPDNKVNSNNEYGYAVDIHFNRFIVSAFRDDAEKQDA